MNRTCYNNIISCNVLSQCLHRRIKGGDTKVLTDIDVSTRGSVAEEAGNYRGIYFLSCLLN